MIRRALLFLATQWFALVAALALGCDSTSSDSKGTDSHKVVNLHVAEFADSITQNGVILIDVRTPEEWAEGVIKGALRINFYDKDFEEQVKKLEKNHPVYVYCKSGGRSSQAAGKLLKIGFTEVYNLIGGITSWNSSGMKIIK